MDKKSGIFLIINLQYDVLKTKTVGFLIITKINIAHTVNAQYTNQISFPFFI